MPTSSSTALIAPPAIIPVPSEAGCIYTLVAELFSLIGYQIVFPFSSTFTKLLFASSRAF